MDFYIEASDIDLKLVRPIRKYADTDIEVVKTLQSYDFRSELWDNLPVKLGYEINE